MALQTKTTTNSKIKIELKKSTCTLKYVEQSDEQKRFISKICSSVRREGSSFYNSNAVTEKLMLYPPFTRCPSTNLELFRVKPVVCWFPYLLFTNSACCPDCYSKDVRIADADEFVVRACLGQDFPYFAIRRKLRCGNPSCLKTLNTFSDKFINAQNFRIKNAWPGLLDGKVYMYDEPLRKLAIFTFAISNRCSL